jgi:ABC-type multidrug transport system fused ATPase/permease subunit
LKVFRSFRLVLGYILELSRQSPRVLTLYILSTTVSVNYLGLAAVLSSLVTVQDRRTATMSFVILLGVWIFGFVNQFLSQDLKLRFEEDVRSRFLSSVIQRLAGVGLMSLESAEIQKTIGKVKDNFPMIQRVLDAPFTLIPSSIGLVFYLSILAHSAPQQFAFVLAYAGLAGYLCHSLIKQITAQERRVAPYRREGGALSAQIMIPTNLAEISRVGDIDWFCKRILECDRTVMLLERRIRRTRWFHSVFSWLIGIALVSFMVLSSAGIKIHGFQLPNFIDEGAMEGHSLLFLTFFVVIGIDHFASSMAMFIAGHSIVSEFLELINTGNIQTTSFSSQTEGEECKSLIVKDVQFCYNGGAPVLTGVNFELPPGRSLAIVGCNGTGKSTLVKIIARVYRETGGVISYGRQMPKIVYMPQDSPVFPSLTVRENILLGESAPESVVENVASRCLGGEMLLDAICSNDYGGFNPSGGQGQLITWARLLVRVESYEPDYIILDEPTSALDGFKERALMNEVLKAGPSVVYITHKGPVARMADDVLFLRSDGTGIFGPAEVLTESEEFKELFG